MAVDPEFAVTADVFNSARQMHFMQQTSDAFFASGFLGKLGIVPDFAFIDGMHLFEFALRDFINVEKHATADTVDGRRTLVTTTNPEILAAMESEEFVGRSITAGENGFVA